MFKLRFLTLVVILCPFLSFSQNDFFKGYVVTLKGDTLIGYVGGKESGTTLKQVQFRSNTTDAIQKFSAADCIAFGLYDRDDYERYTINISMGKVDLGELSTGIDTVSKRETVFLQVLQKGKNVVLYSYTDEIKTRFYVRKKDDKEPMELLFYSFYNPNGTSQIIYNSKYQRQLLILFREYGVEIEDFILERSLYDEDDIVKLVSLINDYKKEKSKYKTHVWYAGAGLVRLATKYFGEHNLVGNDVTSKTSIVPYISAGIDVYVNPAYARTFFRIEVSLLKSKHDIEKAETDFASFASRHQFKQFTGTFSASLLRNLYNSEKYKAYFGAGIAIRYASTSDNITTYKYTSIIGEISGPDLKKIRLQLPISAGLILSNKVDVSISYTLPTNIAENYVMYGIRSNSFKLGANYRF